MKKCKGFSLLPAMVAVFLMAATASAQQLPVNLGSNSTFAILAGTTVTVTGGGSITGDIGVSTGSTFVPGTPPVTVNGTVYLGAGSAAAQAQLDLTTAFNDAAGRATPDEIVSGNIGGRTLTPGLYKSTSSLAISSGELTLDAQGDGNAVFIFQIGSTFTMTSGRQVILAGNANAENIFWQVGSSATLGTTSVLHGNILAAVSISTLTGSQLHGRALAQGGAVSVDTGGGNSVSLPGSASLIPPTVISTVPANGASDVSINSAISATFSTTMNAATITPSSFTLMQGSTPVSGAVTYSGTTATFTPAVPLVPLATYTATVTTGATNLAGTALAANYVWSFTPGVILDITPPTVISTVPSAGAGGVSVNSIIHATFSEAMAPFTITAFSFNLVRGGASVAGTVTYNGTTATLTPAAPLALNASYTATVTTGVTDLAGNTLNSPYTWSFTTGVAAGPRPVIDPDGTINNVTGTVNAASYVRPVAAGSIAAVFGSNLAIGESDPEVATPLRNTLSQSSFTIGGRVAPLYFASPGQVNLQIPWALAGLTQAPIQARVDGETSNLQMVSLAPFGPGIFTIDATGTGQGAILIAPTDQLAAPDHPVLRGEYIAIFCTGLGAVTNQPSTGAPALATPLSFTLIMPTMTIGGAEAVVSYSGLAPGFAGLYQVNAIVPAGASAGSAVPVVLSIGGVTSNTVTIAVQ